jgi:hypothetical protein
VFLALEAETSAPEQMKWLGPVRDVCLYAMLATTLFSGLQYLWRAVAVLRANQSSTAG